MKLPIPPRVNELVNDRARLARLIESTLLDVQMVVLFGSQAKGKATARSDWDIAVLANPGCYEGFSLFHLQEALADILSLSFDHIDLVNLRQCSPLLGFAIACEGIPLYEETSATFRRFQARASKIYADTAKLRKLQRIYLGFEQ